MKVHFMPLHFYKTPTLVPVFVNRKKSKEDFISRNNENKCFATALLDTMAPMSVYESSPVQLLSWELLYLGWVSGFCVIGMIWYITF